MATVTGGQRSKAPDVDELRDRIPQAHPRILFKPRDFERLKDRLEEPLLKEKFDVIRANGDAGLEQPVPKVQLPDDLYLPGQPTWDQRYPSNVESFQAHERMMAPMRALYRLIPSWSLAYHLTGDRRHKEHARQGMRDLAALDLTPTSYTNTHQFHGVIPTLSIGLDYLWDELEPQERDQIVVALVGRAREFHPLSVGQTFSDPLGSHNFVYGPPDMIHATLALFHHEPEAEEWLRDILTFMYEVFPNYGGDDGGWGQGFGYIFSHYYQKLSHMLYIASGLNSFNRPWSRNNGNHLLYFRPPYSTCPSFGDASYASNKVVNKHIMQVYASVHQDPYYQWYADQTDVPSVGFDPLYFLSHEMTWTRKPEPKPPTDLPQAIHLRDIDWVALHSDLADGDRNIMLNFKSSHFGSYSHSHADQNSFVLEAFGHPLLIDSGYYPWYASPHDLSWTRQTRAHNAVLINGKGQGIWNRAAAGHIIAFVTTADFDYTAGDATPAYQQPSLHHGRRDIHVPLELCAASEGVVRAVRHIVFVRPNVFVVLDDVETQKLAAIQFQLHSTNQFGIDGERRVVRVANGPAIALVHLLDPGQVRISQTDQFSVAPEPARNQHFPNQWHLTCDFAPTSSRRRLLTVIAVGRKGEEADLPGTERLEAQDMIGARIGDTSVQFRLNMDSVAVSCRGRRADGTMKWLEYSVAGAR